MENQLDTTEQSVLTTWMLAYIQMAETPRLVTMDGTEGNSLRHKIATNSITVEETVALALSKGMNDATLVHEIILTPSFRRLCQHFPAAPKKLLAALRNAGEQSTDLAKYLLETHRKSPIGRPVRLKKASVQKQEVHNITAEPKKQDISVCVIREKMEQRLADINSLQRSVSYELDFNEEHLIEIALLQIDITKATQDLEEIESLMGEAHGIPHEAPPCTLEISDDTNHDELEILEISPDTAQDALDLIQKFNSAGSEMFVARAALNQLRVENAQHKKTIHSLQAHLAQIEAALIQANIRFQQADANERMSAQPA